MQSNPNASRAVKSKVDIILIGYILNIKVAWFELAKRLVPLAAYLWASERVMCILWKLRIALHPLWKSHPSFTGYVINI